MRRKIIILSLIFTSLSVAPSITLAGFGVSPAKIIENELVKGSVLHRTIYFVQGTPVADLPVKIEVDDSNIKSWITTEPSGVVTIPKGVQQFPVVVTVTVPQDAELGVYKGFVRASSAATNKVGGESSSISVVAGAAAALELTVGQGVHYQYAIRNIDIKSIKETEDPMAEVNIENSGNVPAGPSEAGFELFNKFDDVRLAYVQGVKMERIQPFSVVNVPVKFPLSVSLSPGEYWGLVKLYNEDGAVVREYKAVFNVNKATFFDKYGMYIVYAASFIVLITLLLLIKRLFRRKRRA